MSSEIPQKVGGLVLAVDIFTFVTGLPSTALAFYIFSRKLRQKATPIDILLWNLSISDLLFLLFLPIKMKEAADNAWNMPQFLCPLTNYVFYDAIYNSTLLLTAISVDRYLGAAFPVQYKLKSRPLYAVLASFFFRLILMAHIGTLTYIVNHHSDTIAHPDACYNNFTMAQIEIILPWRLELFLVFFCVPAVICTFCYVKLVCILSRLSNISRRKRLYAIGLALTTLLMFLFCFAPYNMSHLVGYIKWQSPSWRAGAILCSTLNACLDPIIYYFSSSALRAVFKDILWRLGRRQKELCCCPGETDSLPQHQDCPQTSNTLDRGSSENV